MAKKLLTIFFIASSLVVSFSAFTPLVAHAADPAPAAPVDPAKKEAGEKTQVQPEAGVLDEAMAGVMSTLMMLFAWLLGVAAITLDNAVYYTVVTMGGVVNKLAAIGVAWRILRDIGNIILIFGFLAIGISIILDSEQLGYGTKMLPTLLIVAVTLNFSLFVSEAVIDTGNLFATQFYTQINGGQPAKPTEWSVDNAKTEGISQKVLAQMGLQTIYGSAMNPQKGEEVFKAGNSIIIGFMSIILFIVAAFVFFSLAFVLLARFIALVFLIIFSPVGFAGLAMPKLKGMADSWWSTLFQQTITAPILLLLLYIALAVITDAQFLVGFGLDKGIAEGAWTGSASAGNLPGFASIILSYCVAMGLLLAVTISSKKLGAFGSDTATKFAGKMTFGATAYAGRHTIGRAGQGMARRLERSHIGRVPFVGRAILSGADRVAKGSFDIRSTSALKELPFGGVDAGQAHKGGYVAMEKEEIKAREDHAKRLKQTQSMPNTRLVLDVASQALDRYAPALATVRDVLIDNPENRFFVGERERQATADAQREVAEREQVNIEARYGEWEQALRKVQKEEMKPVRDASDAAMKAAEAAKQAVDMERIAAEKVRTSSTDPIVIAEAERKLTEAEADLKHADLDSNTKQLEVQKVLENQRREQAALTADKAGVINEQKTIASAAEKQSAEMRAAPGTEYANNILRSPFTYYSYKAKTSAKNIKEWAKKTKAERDNDEVSGKIKKILADEEKAKGGGTPPPSPPPPAP